MPEEPPLFSSVDAPFYISTSNVGEFSSPFSTSFYYNHSSACVKSYFIVVLRDTSLMTDGTEHLAMCLLALYLWINVYSSLLGHNFFLLAQNTVWVSSGCHTHDYRLLEGRNHVLFNFSFSPLGVYIKNTFLFLRILQFPQYSFF